MAGINAVKVFPGNPEDGTVLYITVLFQFTYNVLRYINRDGESHAFHCGIHNFGRVDPHNLALHIHQCAA